jgi:hypothetical protein
MQEHSSRYLLRNFLSVITGLIIGIAACLLLILFFAGIGLISWSDEGSQEVLAILTRNFRIAICLTFIISCFIGGFMTSLISKSTDLSPSILTGLLLSVVALLLGITFYDNISTYLSIIIAIPFAMIGGWVGNKRKR